MSPRFTLPLVYLTLSHAACASSVPTETQGSGDTSGCESEAPAAPDARSFAEGQQQITVLAAEAKFGPCPAAIPFECEMAVLEGSPRDPGLFTVRFRSQKPWVMPPHGHPRAERVTVVSGRLSVGFGPALDRQAGKAFTTGDYYVNAPGAVHYVWADEPMEIQITGMGPWEVHPHKH